MITLEGKAQWIGAFGLLLAAQVVTATPITFESTLGDRAFSVTFDVSGTDLVVTLTNTSDADVKFQNSILTAVFFDSAAPLSLTATSAVLANGSTVLFGTTDPGNVVGGEWAYKSGLVGAPWSLPYGISSAGFGLVGPQDRFPGTNLQGPDSPDGVQYGITSAGDNPATGQTAVTGQNALIQNSVVLTLSGLPVGYDPSEQIPCVVAQYGTALDDPSFRVPEPATMAILGLGSVILLGVRRKR